MTEIDPIEIKRMKWRSRRGLLELDLVLERFIQTGRFDQMSQPELVAYQTLLTLPDNDFLDLVNGKAEPEDLGLLPVLTILRSI